MPLDLDNRLKERLVEILANEIPQIRVNNCAFLRRASLRGLRALDNALPQNGRLNATLAKFVGDAPASSFVDDEIGRHVNEANDFDLKSVNQPLTNFRGFEDPVAAANSLANAFDALPREYRLTVRLPVSLNELLPGALQRFEVSTEVSLIRPDQEFSAAFPLKTQNERRDRSLELFNGFFSLMAPPGTYDPKWSDTLHLQITQSGFIGRYEKTQPLYEGEDLVKTFFGLALAVNLIEFNRSYRPSPSLGHFLVHRIFPGRAELESKHDFSLEMSEMLSDSVLADFSIALALGAQKEDLVRMRLNEIAIVMGAGASAQRVILGAQWFFDSLCGRNEMLAFVQAMVVLEILLGDKSESDAIGLGQLLKSRCAYLIGRSNAERAEILDLFGKIYAVRSEIVHGGKSRLNQKERGLFFKLQWLCQRVIQREMELLDRPK